MSFATGVTIFIVLLTIAGVVGIVHHHLVPREKQKRGTEPGEGDTLVYAKERIAFFGAGNEDAAGRMTRVTRDPQQYARGFVPSHAKQDKRK